MAIIRIQESVLARFNAQAQRRGVSLDVYLEHLAELHMPGNNELPRLTGEELERVLEAESSSEAMYEGTYPRVDIYRDHD